MLLNLRIKNLALIEDLLWEPSTSFLTLTGETGAGKSILIDGLMLLAGERGDKSLIRTGETACAVEAEIAVPKKLAAALSAILEKIGAEPCDGDRLLLKRSLPVAGTNKQFINGSPVTLQGLKEVGDLLIDLHGPHDHQSLLSVDKQLDILDAFGQFESLRAEVATRYDAVTSLEKERDSLQLNERERAEKVERLTRHHRDISEARLKPGEDEQIERDFRLANNARQLVGLAGAVTDLLSEGEVNALSLVAQIEKQLAAWQKIDPEIDEITEHSHQAASSLQELARAVSDYAERIDLDAETLQQLEERLDLLNGLKRKYGPALADVIAHGEESARQLEALESSGATVEEIEKKLTLAQTQLRQSAQQLSQQRRKLAPPLAEKIQSELRELGFVKAQFQIACTELSTPSRWGLDQIEFIFAPNVGEAPQPLRMIASSGEMARVMLAIKSTLAEVDALPILVFDEVDANVGGETAWQVGQKLKRLGRTHQVLCITHQPQVAAQGESHFAVRKETIKDRTVTTLEKLEGKNRLKEIARMLGGENKESLALAQKMIEGKR